MVYKTVENSGDNFHEKEIYHVETYDREIYINYRLF